MLLDYTHFSVLLRTDRRLAAITAVGIDGNTLQDINHSGFDWRLDTRVPVEQQVGSEVYRDNDLDRGHLGCAGLTPSGGLPGTRPTKATETPSTIAARPPVDEQGQRVSAPPKPTFRFGVEIRPGPDGEGRVVAVLAPFDTDDLIFEVADIVRDLGRIVLTGRGLPRHRLAESVPDLTERGRHNLSGGLGVVPG